MTTPTRRLWWAAAALLLVAGCQTGVDAAPTSQTEPSSSGSPTEKEPTQPGYSLVALGDSLPFAGPDCGGCPSFATLYGAMVEESAGQPARVKNLSMHDGVTTPVLVDRLRTSDPLRAAVAGADIVLISAGHNDTPWNLNDDPCDGPSGNDIDWSAYTAECAREAADGFGPVLDDLLTEVELLRDGAPTAIRVINFYNDWIGWADAPPEVTPATVAVLDAFSAVICDVAAAHDAACADTYHAFNGPDGASPAGALLADDYTHPSAAGHELIADVLFDVGLAPLY